MKLFKALFSLSLLVLLTSCMSDTSSKEVEKEDGDGINIEINGNKISIDKEDQKDLENALQKSKDALGDLFKGDENGEEVEVVNFRDLKDLLPKRVGSLKMEDSEGSTSKVLGIQISQVSGEYRDGKSNMDINIIDAGNAGSVVKFLASWTSAELDSESSNGYQKTTEYKGYRAYEEYDSKNNSGSFAVLIQDRFIVNISGNNIEMDDLKDAIDDISIRKIERMIS